MARSPLRQTPRLRARALGIEIGRYQPGRYNAITDVPGVRVGHTTVIRGRGDLRVGRGPIRSGVTAILPSTEDIFEHRLPASGFVLNGAGEVAGLTQLMEWGLLESPIMLTNTLSVGAVSEATWRLMLEQHPEMGTECDVAIPIVGECDDSWLNDAAGGHIKPRHVRDAIGSATSGSVTEGCVGAGTGMVTCDFAGGIGTSSRQLPRTEGGYTVGVLVLSNFGRMQDLRVDGLPIGEALAADYATHIKRFRSYGSIIAVVATNAPLLSNQLHQVCKRVALGIGRAGSSSAFESGEIVVGFSTANRVPRSSRKRVQRLEALIDRAINPVFQAAIEATEEAILNAVCMGDTTEGHSGHVAPGLPLNKVRALVARAKR
jgi:D-aminopeptidase